MVRLPSSLAKAISVLTTRDAADHTMGIITLLRNALGIFRGDSHAPPVTPRPVRQPKIQIYGPAGIRQLVRTTFKLTHTRSADQYCVHELLFPGEEASAPADDVECLHPSEEAGTDIHCAPDGFWRKIAFQATSSGRCDVIVDAGPIEHRGDRRIFQAQLNESTPYTLYPRSIVILGDTSNPTALIPLVKENPTTRVSLLVHEATDAYIPPHVDPHQSTGKNRTAQSVTQKAIEKGHSTPAMAGIFARQIGAEMLALNHIGARFPAPPAFPRSGRDKFRRECMAEIETQANRVWMLDGGGTATAVSDFDQIVIAPIPPVPNEAFESQEEEYFAEGVSPTAGPSSGHAVREHN
ncbi:hypothetical protein PHLGIDRAFT_75569 [Phlebiopsis gigantea 11061_1 CR5-6]|uniref:Metallo-beta-lactamase domain-containing protein n=1 Tax=Phlebiopsis gigantea (strain 11061_1 CR5-6) TaxID=745531 RepID=A0A0C3S7D9_PHLG1|nr:hypothetical protein PHLGIDRAFT_75569 [Phlebiopsis gigantea 11061_1 CR5-6]